ncbi:YqgE/AlgH family protein [Chitinophaga solisilvae]|uniref:YqgE/AlgH family protein n=1 Tax=Chitinophaga solisilvae TaxID=1233460 RepID=UPI00136F8115|nr:YqgE/AlgH family protein [Chitinophaga solisilvae]
MKAGTFIRSTSLLDDTFFEKSILFIASYNEQGALGFVINREFLRKFNELEEFRHSVPFTLYDGGPVDKEHLYFVHRRPDLIPDGELITDNIYLGGDFKAAVMHMNNHTLSANDMRIFIGYCGWDSQELEAEIAEGSWTILDEGRLF